MGGTATLGMLREYSLHKQADRDVFDHGRNAGYTSSAGYAVVVAKYENKAVFIDLQALFADMRKSYFTTEENFQKTLQRGDAPGEWPFAFASAPEWTPVVVKTVDIARPTAVLARMDGASAARAVVASEDGTLTFFKLGGLATEAPASPGRDSAGAAGSEVGSQSHLPDLPEIRQRLSGRVCAATEGNRVDWRMGRQRRPSCVDCGIARLIDPVSAEVADTPGIQGPFVSVIDFAGRQILNYRFGVLTILHAGRNADLAWDRTRKIRI